MKKMKINKTVMDAIVEKYDSHLMNVLYPAQYGYLMLAIRTIEKGGSAEVNDIVTKIVFDMILIDYICTMKDLKEK